MELYGECGMALKMKSGPLQPACKRDNQLTEAQASKATDRKGIQYMEKLAGRGTLEELEGQGRDRGWPLN